MKKTNTEQHLEQKMKERSYRVEYTLLDLAAEIAETIKSQREAKGMSQSELAHILQTKQSRVSQMEDPLYARYSLSTLVKVADALECRVSVDFMRDMRLKHRGRKSGNQSLTGA